MAANFPNSPSTNDTFTSNGVTFTWNGSAWKQPASPGVKGLKGEKGEKGEKGQKGDKGEKGQKGEVGLSGNVGGKGDKGEKGEKGEKGQKGDKGEKGQKGDKGEKGQKGDKGEKGQKGEVGAQGPGGSATIANNADNRVITGGSGTNLNAESTLLYDGTTLSTGADGTGVLLSIGDDGQNNTRVLQVKRTTSKTTIPNIQAVDAGSGASNLELQGEGGNVAIGDVSPSEKLHVDGSVRITGGIRDKDNELGTSGQVLSSTGTQLNWVAATSGQKGEVGQKGQKGEDNSTKGQKGDDNSTKGQKGEKGQTGADNSTKGQKGQKGEVGAQGSGGSAGTKGEKGQKGEVGAQGTGGSAGSDGAKGQKGEVGAQGNQGTGGSTGAKGQKGEVGSQGAQGDTGATGASGPATVPQIKKAENTAQFYTSNNNTHTRVTLALTGVDNNSHVLIMWRAEIFSGSGTGANCQTYLDGGSFTGGSTSGTHNVQNWAGFGDITIDRGSGTSRTYTIKFKKNSGAQAYFRNGYLFAMEMKPN